MAKRDHLRAALKLARRGWAVFPLDGKKPYPGTSGFHDATLDRKQIRRWWKQWPTANIGIACSSQRGPIVVDIDGKSGQELADQLDLPETREATSGRPHRKHLYYDPFTSGLAIGRLIKLKHNGVKHDFDILGDGGYVVAPPSIHPETGKPYTWLNKRRPVPMPESILQLVRASKATSHAAAPLPSVIGEGERDNLLTSLAGSMRRRGASEDAILAALREENATRVVPPLEDKDLKRIAKSIARKPPVGTGENFTDLGNARRFIAQHHEHVRSVGMGRRPWMLWEENRWVPDTTGEIERFAKTTVRLLQNEAASEPDAERRDAILVHAARSEQATRIRAMLELAATEPEITSTPEAFDADPWLFNVENGTIDLRTGKLKPHDRNDLLTKLSSVEFNPKAKAPLWNKFLLEVMDGDKELVEFLQRAVGYALTGDVREECFFFLYGRGSNGKSTFLEVLRDLFGDYGQQADFNTFLARKGEGPRNDLARMRGARLVVASEADQERGFDSAVIKQLTGGDTVVARKLYEELTEFRPQHKIFLAANHKPIVKEQTEAFWRRLRLVPFVVTFSARERDKTLKKQLLNELPGILNWAIKGCLLWQEHGLFEPKAIKQATRSYREENDVLGEFIEQRCDMDPDAWISTPELYKHFSEWWVDTRGVRNAPISAGWFVRMMSERQNVMATKRNKHRGWKGITIKR